MKTTDTYETKDPKIKLFGRTIELPENSAADESGEPGPPRLCGPAADDICNQDPTCSSDSMLEDCNFLSGDAEDHDSLESPSFPEQDQSKEEDGRSPIADSNPSLKDSKTEDQIDQNEKTLKKPDKILPCPRCNSTDTKFCYFNNYNVNQPRHFCKNCQRYWTAGGTMRNVPVGAGRRKNKNTSISQLPESLQSNTILTFGSDSPHCESSSSVLNIIDHTVKKGPNSGLPRPEDIDNGPSKSSITSTDESPVQNCNPIPPQVPCFPGPQWAYPWNPVQWGPGSFSMPYWNVPWVVPPMHFSTFGPNSPILGKHSREDDESTKVSNPEKCLWVPKTLRIDDLSETAKSSIWATLGIKKDVVDSDGIFKAFRREGKVDEKGSSIVMENCMVLQANPAAMSRSLSFHESS